MDSRSAGRSATSRAARAGEPRLAKADKAVESTLRRGAVNAELRRNPAVRARMRAMPKRPARSATPPGRRSRRPEARARDLRPRQQRARRLPRALAVRAALPPRVFPFYAWYKAITKIAAKLPIDYARPRDLSRSSTRSASRERRQLGPLPSYLRGRDPARRRPAPQDAGLNPLETINAARRRAAVPFVPGRRTNALAGVMNPFVQAPAPRLRQGLHQARPRSPTSCRGSSPTCRRSARARRDQRPEAVEALPALRARRPPRLPRRADQDDQPRPGRRAQGR
jgi:hypothetical protein